MSEVLDWQMNFVATEKRIVSKPYDEHFLEFLENQVFDTSN